MADDGLIEEAGGARAQAKARSFKAPTVNKGLWIWAFGPLASIWYILFVMSQTWPTWDPATIAQATTTYFGFVMVTLFYIAIQFLAMLRGTAGKNITKEGAVLGDAFASAVFPLIGYGVLGFFYARGEYRPTELDIQFLVISFLIIVLDVAGFTWIAYRANRRGDEIVGENH